MALYQIALDLDLNVR